MQDEGCFTMYHQDLPEFLLGHLFTDLIVISYLVLERTSLSEILLAAGARHLVNAFITIIIFC